MTFDDLLHEHEQIDNALAFFNEHGYLIINAMRRSGKTNILCAIIEQNPDKKIGVHCPNLRQFENHYRRYKNCTYVARDTCHSFDILIGDEIRIEPIKGTPTACAYTSRYIELTLEPTEQLKQQIKKEKCTMSQLAYETNFGQYLKHHDITKVGPLPTHVPSIMHII